MGEDRNQRTEDRGEKLDTKKIPGKGVVATRSECYLSLGTLRSRTPCLGLEFPPDFVGLLLGFTLSEQSESKGWGALVTGQFPWRHSG